MKVTCISFFKYICIRVQVQVGGMLLKEPPPSNVISYHISNPITYQTEQGLTSLQPKQNWNSTNALQPKVDVQSTKLVPPV